LEGEAEKVTDILGRRTQYPAIQLSALEVEFVIEKPSSAL